MLFAVKIRALILVVTVTSLPFVLNLLGADFSSKSATGTLHHVLMEWSAVSIAVIAALVSFLHFYRYRDITVPIIGMAFFCAGLIDAFHTLAATGIINLSASNSDFIPFTWAFSRIFNAAIIIIGIGISIWMVYKQPLTNSRPSSNRNQITQLAVISLLFISIAIIAVFLTSTSAQLPKTTFPAALIIRPFDVLPLAMFLLTAALAWNWYRQRPEIIKYALLLSLVPQTVTQLHMSFGSTEIFDNHFNIAHMLKIIAYFCILFGVLFDLFQRELSSRNSKEEVLVTDSSPELEGLVKTGQATRPQAITIPAASFVLAIVVSLLVGGIFYLDTERLVRSQEIEELKIESQLVEPLLSNFYKQAYGDVLFLSRTPAIQEFIQSENQNDEINRALWQSRIEQIFSEILDNKPNYFKIRYIGVDNDGLELVNVYREEEAIIRVRKSELQQKSERTYFKDMLTLSDGNVYFSRIELNQEHGKISTPHQPVLRIGTPIFDQSNNELFGFLVISADFGFFRANLLKTSLQNINFYLSNQSGDYLIHPDNSKTFGFDLGERHLMQEEFPPLKDIFNKQVTQLEMTDELSFFENTKQTPNGFYRLVQLPFLEKQNNLHLLLTFDHEVLQQQLADFRNRSFIVGLGLAIIALALAVFGSRRITAPLLQTTSALEHFERHGELLPLPINSKDEIGVLARNFHNMLTLRKARDRELAEQKFALDQHAIVAVTDVKGNITFANEKFAEISGYTVEELVGQNHRIVNSGYHDTQFWQDMYTTIANGKVWHGEFKNRAKLGNIYWVDTTIVPFLGPNGKPQSYIAIRTDITERKQMELELAEKSKHLELVIDSTAVGVWDWQVQTGEVLFNQRWAEIIGYQLQELEPTDINTWINHCHPEDLIESGKLLEKHWSGESQRYVFEARMKHKSGDWVWVLDTGKVVEWHADGKPKRMIGTHLDITERKNAELAISETMALLESTIESTDNAILVTSTEGKILRTNSRFVSLWDIPDKPAKVLDESSVVKTISQYLKKPEILTKNLESFKQDKFAESTEMLVLTDGRIIEKISQPMLMNKTPIGRVWSFRDVTQRMITQQQQKQLLESTQVKLNITSALNQNKPLSQRLDNVLSTILTIEGMKSKGGIYLYDEKTRVLQLLCYCGELSIDFLKEESTIEIGQGICGGVAETGQLLICDSVFDDERVMTKWSELEDCGLYILPMNNRTERRHNVLGIVVLASEKKPDKSYERLTLLKEIGDILSINILNENVNQQLEIARHEAEESSRLKSEFLASMSHEIRTPMNGVLGMLGLLLNSPLNQDQKHKAHLAQSSAQSLLALINDILDFSKVDAGKLELEIFDFNLRQMLDEFAESMAHRAQDKGLELILDITNVEHSLVTGDPGRLRQILTNLVGNSIKFTEQGEILIKASLSRSYDNRLQFDCTVSDTGIGVPTEKQKTLFAPFSQADASTTRKFGGTGLGLSIVKKLCELMGGDISVHSEPGIGSSFQFIIFMGLSGQSEIVLPEIAIDKLDILVVDDNSTNREVLRGQLEHWGAEVYEAEDGKTALALCEARAASDEQRFFDAALLDMQMPEMDGSELGQKLQADSRFRQMKLIMMTSMSHRGDAQHFAKLGFHAYFPKPATTSDLFSALSVVIDDGEALAKAQPLVTHHYLKTLKTGESKETYLESENHQWIKPFRILLVEDNQVNQEVARGILGEFGLNADVAGNGLEAINLLKTAPENSPYSLILMDCQMPEMDGYQASRVIRDSQAGEENKEIIIIAMTANAMKGDREKCLAAGMDDYISKPVEPNELFEKLAHRFSANSRKKMAAEAISNKTDSKSQVSAEPELDNLPLDELPCWDKQAALKRVLGKQPLLKKLMALFIEDMPGNIQDLKEAVESGDADKVRHIAHTIKGAAGNISGLRLQESARLLELACKKQNNKEWPLLMNNIQTSHEELHQVLQDSRSEETHNTPPRNKIVTNKELDKFLESLAQKLESGSYISNEELLPISEPFEDDNIQSKLSKLVNYVDQFDTHSALALVDDIRSNVLANESENTDKAD
ncbi:response regulator [Aliikangiella coralliicola]|uniref:response regulator n=1 Tax=Aliikangiella coralliicola TaxID=2592383 RepID=UPI001AEFE6B7|nr:response regulator [Aliikangiella coralliicola]